MGEKSVAYPSISTFTNKKANFKVRGKPKINQATKQTQSNRITRRGQTTNTSECFKGRVGGSRDGEFCKQPGGQRRLKQCVGTRPSQKEYEMWVCFI